jgi:hypothetical protein
VDYVVRCRPVLADAAIIRPIGAIGQPIQGRQVTYKEIGDETPGWAEVQIVENRSFSWRGK